MLSDWAVRCSKTLRVPTGPLVLQLDYQEIFIYKDSKTLTSECDCMWNSWFISS